jgi:hypothetical protein
MFKSIEELQAFILWCKQNKIKHFKNGGIEFDLSDLAFVEDLMQDKQPVKEMVLGGSRDLLDTMVTDPKEEEDLLYHSAV